MMIDFQSGNIPLLVSFPHSGIDIPQSIATDMTAEGRAIADTDWFLPRLYDFELLRSASLIKATFSRYVIDPNRPVDGSNLYPGRPTTALCPVTTFDGEEIYLPGKQPDPAEIQRRIGSFWQPYHDCLNRELDRLKREYGCAVLFDAHSIVSRLPRLFDGDLPDFNIGTANSQSCSPLLQSEIDRSLGRQGSYSHVVNGRFVGGYITRRYGQPERDIHAVQLELSKATYMDEAEQHWHDERACAVRPIIENILETIVQWIRRRSRH